MEKLFVPVVPANYLAKKRETAGRTQKSQQESKGPRSRPSERQTDRRRLGARMVRRRPARRSARAAVLVLASAAAAVAGAASAAAGAVAGGGPGHGPPRYAGADPDTDTYTTSWDSSPFNLESVTDNNLGLVAKSCSEKFCHAGINGLDLWISFEEVR